MVAATGGQQHAAAVDQQQRAWYAVGAGGLHERPRGRAEVL